MATVKNSLFFTFTTKGLDQCNKDILTTRLLADAKVIGDTNNESLSHQIRSVFLDWKVWFHIFIYMSATTPVYGINSLLPTIIKDMYHTNSTNAGDGTIQVLTIPPYFASFLTMIISSWNAGRLNERSNHMMVLLVIQISGFLYLILAKRYLYIGATLIVTCMLSCDPLNLSWITNNIGGQTKRAVTIALAMAFGAIGAIVGEHIYGEADEPLYNQGHWIVTGILCFTFILVLLLKLLLKHENRRRRNIKAVHGQAEAVADERQPPLDQVNFV